MRTDKVSVVLRNDKELTFILEHSKAGELMDQFYELCSEGLLDNLLEVVVASNDEKANDTVLIKCDEIVYMRRIKVDGYE